MTYVVSDLHGSAEKFERLLRKIRFTDDDVMYVLGDIVDYGDGSMDLLCDLSMRFNVIPIVGDHDLRAQKLLTVLDGMLRDGSMPDDPTVLTEMTEWIRDGGQPTMEGFKALDDDMKEGVLEYLADMSLYEEVEVRGNKYLLVHAGIADFDAATPLEDYMPEDFVREALQPNTRYFDDVTVIAGHVPTYEIEGAERGRIFRGNGSILIDCGAAFDEPLACLRLEDGEEFYIV